MRKSYCCVGILCMFALALTATAGTPDATLTKQAKVKAPATLNAEVRPAAEFNGIRQGGDTCETATVIPGLPYSNTGTTADATDDYDAACTWTATAPDVVYVFTPTADVAINISVCESAYDTKLFVYEGACTDGTEIACVDDSCSNTAGDDYRSNIDALALTAGNDYYIVVDGYEANSGEYAIEITEFVPPMGRCCADDATCTETLEADCTGTWAEGLDCTEPCPEPLDCMFGQEVVGPDGDWSFGNIQQSSNFIKYDNFSGMTAPIQDITIWALELFHNGTGWETCDYTGQLEVVIYEDNAGAPGAVVSTQTVSITSKVPTGQLYSGYESSAISFSITPVMQASGWISLQSLATDCALLWGNSLDGDLMSLSDDGTTVTTEEFDLSLCFAGEYVPAFGACCDDTDGSCDDNIELINCDGRFVADTLCTAITPECGNPGACCDDLFGDCWTDFEANCEAPFRFTAGVDCAAMDPACGAATGACCNPDGTCEQTAEGDCQYNFLGILTDCADCPCVVDCPEGSVLEQEACGEDTNGGCNSDPYAAESIAAGETVCGTVWSSTETRDTDWYELVLTTDSIVTIVGEGDIATANGGFLFGLVSGPCDTAAFVANVVADECDPQTIITECVPAGTYWVFASVGDFLDNPCDNKYSISVAVEECVIPRGACCYGDAMCYENISEDECTAAGGNSWLEGVACVDADCPELPAGVNCEMPLVAEFPAALPFVDDNKTCGMVDDYEDTELGYYDGGEDTVYEITVTEPISITLTLDPQGSTWAGVGLFDACPDTGALVTKSTSSGSDPHTSDCVELTPGTYYVMVDTWPNPECLEAYTLTIEACTPPNGRCCYDGGYQCSEVTNAECDALGGAWDVELTCEDTCPIAPGNDTCDGAYEICCGTLKEGTTVGTLVDGGPDCNDEDDVETPDKEVWYTFIGTGQEMTVHTCGSTEDTIVAVYEGTCDGLVCVAADDDTDYCDDKSTQSAVTLCTDALKRYYVAVWDYGANDPIDFMIGVDCGGLCTQGACCLPDGTCEQTFEMQCEGQFLGAGTDCADCPVFECTGTDEAEACGDDTNGGCNADTGFPTEAAALNATICGTSWADGSTRDTDWYQITLTEDSTIDLTFVAEYPIVVGMMGDATQTLPLPVDCSNEDLQLNPYATAGWLEEGNITSACLPAGDYVVFVSATVYEGYPCDNGYSLEIAASACTPRPTGIRPVGVSLFGGAVQQAVNGQFQVNGLNSMSNTPQNDLQQVQQGEIQIIR